MHHQLSNRIVACLLIAALLSSSAFITPGRAQEVTSVPAGYDLFETDSRTTQFSFTGDFVLPAGFFDTGSKPFKGTVKFQGVPLGTFMGQPIGMADMIVQRKGAASFPKPFPSSDTIPIEIVALSLTSTKPIKVKVGKETQLWDVKAELSTSRPSTGSMTITKRDEKGGTFDVEITPFLLFRFIRRSDDMQKTFDIGALELSQKATEKLTLRARKVPWVHTFPEGVVQVEGLNDDFCAGATSKGAVLIRTTAKSVKYGMRPAPLIPVSSKITLAFVRGDRLPNIFKLIISQEKGKITPRYEIYPLQLAEGWMVATATAWIGEMSSEEFADFWSLLIRLNPFSLKDSYTATESYPDVDPPTGGGPGVAYISYKTSGGKFEKTVDVALYLPEYDSEFSSLFYSIWSTVADSIRTKEVKLSSSQIKAGLGEVIKLSSELKKLATTAIKPIKVTITTGVVFQPSGDTVPDFDNDGIPDRLDVDDDNDGVPDWQDQDSNDPNKSRDTDGDGIDDTADDDIDGDGVKNDVDNDDDGDGNSDDFEREALEAEQNLRNRDDPELNDALDALNEQNEEGSDHIDEDTYAGPGDGRYHPTTGQTTAGSGTADGEMEDVIAHEARHAQQDKMIEDGAADNDKDLLPDNIDPDTTTRNHDNDPWSDVEEDAYRFEEDESPNGVQKWTDGRANDVVR